MIVKRKSTACLPPVRARGLAKPGALTNLLRSWPQPCPSPNEDLIPAWTRLCPRSTSLLCSYVWRIKDAEKPALKKVSVQCLCVGYLNSSVCVFVCVYVPKPTHLFLMCQAHIPLSLRSPYVIYITKTASFPIWRCWIWNVSEKNELQIEQTQQNAAVCWVVTIKAGAGRHVQANSALICQV